ncbi:MAG: c-type cytochrome [Bacteroidia bacterium]
MQKGDKVLLSIFCSCLIIGCISHYSTTTETAEAAKQKDSFNRGKNLAFNICGQCHYNDSAKSFIGLPMHDLPSFMGKVYSANLTHSVSHGVLTKYSDAELRYLIKTGVSREGKYVPYMIRPNISEKDLNDITVYLRSNDSAVAAVNKTMGKTDVNLLGKMATKIAGKPLLPYKATAAPDENNPVLYGKYLIDNLACYHCHSKSILGLNYREPEKSNGYMQGGMKFKTPAGKKIFSANLTPDKETGIGNFTNEDFRNAVTKGVLPTKDSLRLPMQKFRHLTNQQCDAIFAYLQSLQPKKNKIKR